MKKKTQLQRILEHLEKYGSISTFESFSLYGDTRLSDKIYRLRKKGYEIISQPTKGKNRFGDDVDYVTYILATKKTGTANTNQEFSKTKFKNIIANLKEKVKLG